GLLVDTGGPLWETSSAGRTWVRVLSPSWRGNRTLLCGPEGGALGARRRLGGGLASATAPTPVLAATSAPNATSEKKRPVPGAAPLRCATGEALRIKDALLD